MSNVLFPNVVKHCKSIRETLYMHSDISFDDKVDALYRKW